MPFSRVCAAAAGLTLVVTIVAIGITTANRSLNREVQARQQFINQGVLWGQVNLRLANSLALAAEREHDERIRKLLEEHGITIRVKSLPAAPAPAASGVKK